MFLLLWNARQSGTLAAVVFALPYLLGAWWLKPGTLRRGLVTVAVAGIVLGSLAFLALAMAAAIPPEYFDRTPKEMHTRITALGLFLLTQAVLVIAAARAYFRARRGPLG